MMTTATYWPGLTCSCSRMLDTEMVPPPALCRGSPKLRTWEWEGWEEGLFWSGRCLGQGRQGWWGCSGGAVCGGPDSGRSGVMLALSHVHAHGQQLGLTSSASGRPPHYEPLTPSSHGAAANGRGASCLP